MTGCSDAPRAWGLTQSMAEACGVNLTGAVLDGWVSRADLTEIVEKCACCGQTEACETLVAGAEAQSADPAFCPNTQTLAALRF